MYVIRRKNPLLHRLSWGERQETNGLGRIGVPGQVSRREPFLEPRCVSWWLGAVTDGSQVFDGSVLLLRCQQDDAKSRFGDWSSTLMQLCFQLAYPFFRLLAQLALGLQAWDVVLGAGVVPVQPSLPPAEVQPQGFAVSPQFSVG